MEVYIMDENNQKINCTVKSCKYNNCNYNLCGLQQIQVQACKKCSTGRSDESMCGSYECK